ncbi:MAG: hypothetical protein KBT04_03885 [Bacteroidales bacterium]|nr:hypothetical protein [Candidatus Colimorpha onthohippi]
MNKDDYMDSDNTMPTPSSVAPSSQTIQNILDYARCVHSITIQDIPFRFCLN